MLQSVCPPAAVSVADPAQFRRHLREATASSHAQLDRRFEAVADPSETEIYRAFVRMNHVCHTVLEPWLAKAVPPAILPLRRPLDDELGADMEALGLTPLPTEPIVSDVGRAWPMHEAVAEAAGVVYVLDGSRLGARMILKEWARRGASRSTGDPSAATPVDDTFGVDATARPGTAYLNAAASPGPVFAAFDELAAQIRLSDYARVACAAQAAFNLFQSASTFAIGADT
ncbi:biliverdin-producing heme oxygenase [Acuticoccus sp. M5D2P5]|uniref:biliverdin-producing heme oxygenase n=1 Tax=Acuticoccus kalidii TaxID=2910977 RepID=UPI001F26ACC3|nr:biliverdin-producing heme oxygenase [Acuticoccus kalidii]MCF3932560.1 biliverdin-producing heme oxygenase [Acuticoccus kalidii]